MKSLQGEPVNKSSNKPTIKAVSKLNPQTGVVSNIAAQFSADKWRDATSGYVVSIAKMKKGSLDEIVKLAMPYMSPSKSRRQGSTSNTDGLAGDTGNDMRACLADKWRGFFLWFAFHILIALFSFL
jgi:hypothetical protein